MTGPKPLALVTGASSGIGRALALRLAQGGYDLALVSRDAARLSEVAAQAERMGARSVVVARDLSKPGAAHETLSSLGGRPVEVLVNNAGFGVHGEFSETDSAMEAAMVQTHIGALLDFTKLVLPGMIERGHGRIVNIGSLYSYLPVPHQAVYGATKAFLLSFSESLNGELQGTGVTVTSVLPGMTQTEFRSRAGVTAKRIKGMTSEQVAEAAFRAMQSGRRIVVPGLINKAFVTLARALPGSTLSALMRALNRFRGIR